MGFVVFLVLFLVVAVAGYLVVTRFRMGDTALWVFGAFLLLVLVLYVAGVIPPLRL